MAIDHVWNLPALAVRLGMDEHVMRKALSESCQHDRIIERVDPSNPNSEYKYRTYLPSIGGVTVYFIGDANKLRDPTTQVAVRCHDECSGSDTFGTGLSDFFCPFRFVSHTQITFFRHLHLPSLPGPRY